MQAHINGLVQDCSISSALAVEILQSCTKPSIETTSPHLMYHHEGKDNIYYA